ncbi:MAG TPA: type IV pilin protein [Oceanospirillales bacterium]|nr:pilus assembly protein PilE [Oceanospirillaceae bacterium]HBS42914.1 type IV pilin protein [Oceanospirillales bacterium]|tara:strand:+ start:3676 stop:4110 length:435 start_codon:yes stop_codon:yes gene_type:complete
MRYSRAFTLMELMIAVAIIGILAAIAYPSYQDYVRKSNRTEAVKVLQAILDGEERYYLANDTYTSTLGSGGLGLNVNVSDQVELEHYNISAGSCSDSSGTAMAMTLCVELQATAQGNQVTDGNLIINTLGRAVRNDGSEYLLTE